ncbi:Uncharacterised protein [Pantoea agglomerans]|nr:Uncharacterised protein [Pantoea agglomerans]
MLPMLRSNAFRRPICSCVKPAIQPVKTNALHRNYWAIHSFLALQQLKSPLSISQLVQLKLN